MIDEGVHLRVRAAPGVELNVIPRGFPGGRDDVGDPTGTVPFLLVHGLASNARMWDGMADALLARGHPSVSVDQRGHGRSDKPDSGYDFGTLSDDLVAVIDELGLDRPIAVGQSWGGNVVLELASRHPDLVRGVVGVDGGTIELARVFPEWDEAAVALAPPDLLGTPIAEMERRIRGAHLDWPESGIQGALANFRVLDDGTIAPWLTRTRHMIILRELWQHRPADVYASLRVPILLLAVERDDSSERAASHRTSVEEAVAASRDARVVWFRGADHDLHAQLPERCATEILVALEQGFFHP